MNQFAEYIQHGWKLCRIEPGTKGPRQTGWNLEENALTSAEGINGAGLLHSYSGTCALDIDRMDDAAAFLAQHNINLADLLADPAAVQIVSGRPNRGKLLYALAAPLPSKSFCGSPAALELRCGNSKSTSVQDVLPPSIHKDTGKPYQWKGDWRALPSIPEPLLALWKSLLVFEPIHDRAATGNSIPALDGELTDLLSRRDPNCGYHEWLQIGMAIHHETGGSNEGLAIWDDWSSPSDKYPGLEVLSRHWASFRGSETPITMDSLRRADRPAPADFEDVSAAASWLDDAPAEKQPDRPRFLSLMELFRRPEPSWIIQGVLPEAGFGIIYGQWGSGKTFTAIDVALSIALGAPWRGIPVKQGSILYVAAEDNRGVQMRFAAGLACHGAQDAPIKVLPAAPRLTDKASQKALLDDIKQESRPSLIFIDTLTAVTPGAEENSSKDMGELVSYCNRIHNATGALVLLIHHEGKTPGRGMRGSSALPDSCDVIWEISKDEMQHEMKVEKVKNAQDGGVYGFRLLPVANSCIVEWI